MKFTILSATLTLALASAQQGSLDSWAPGGPDDFRGPCPMMNTLANHGFLNHDGKNLTQEVVVGALTGALNFNESIATIMFQQALPANPDPNATFFTLDMLNRHNVLEHDASMSRSDAFFGNNHVFNETIFEQTTAYWTDEIMDVTMIADGKVARQVQSRASNPEYTFTATMEEFSLGEMSAPFLIFGDIEAQTVNRTLVTYFFQNERLPVELGWTKQANPITLDQVSNLNNVIRNATKLQTTGTPVVTDKRRRDSHFGFI